MSEVCPECGAPGRWVEPRPESVTRFTPAWHYDCGRVVGDSTWVGSERPCEYAAGLRRERDEAQKRAAYWKQRVIAREALEATDEPIDEQNRKDAGKQHEW